jgi:hypothetical protein
VGTVGYHGANSFPDGATMDGDEVTEPVEAAVGAAA